jgi:response regulator of citrate/malate metabolism
MNYRKLLSVLIVDDNQFYIERMTEMLNDLDGIGQIDTAENCKEAYSQIGNVEHDLVLLDINLPDGNGLNLLKQIKGSSGKTEVIMVSNSSDDFYRRQSKELGAYYFLDKTNDFEMMPAILLEMNSC